MKVLGRQQIVYECDTSEKKVDNDGVLYKVKNKENCRVKILNKEYCKKSQEMEIYSKFMNGENWNGNKILDMVYSHGKFTGILLEAPAPSEPVVIQNSGGDEFTREGRKEHNRYYKKERLPQNHVINGRNSTVFDENWMKILYAVLMIGIFAILTYFIFFNIYLAIIENMFSLEIAEYCYMFNFSGITGIVGGGVASIFLMRRNFENGGFLYYVLIPIGFLVGMIIIFVGVTILIVIISTVISILLAIVPIIVALLILVCILKYAFSNR